MSDTKPTFNGARLDVYALLTEAQNLLLDAPQDRTGTQSRAVREVLSYLAAAKQALVHAAPRGDR